MAEGEFEFGDVVTLLEVKRLWKRFGDTVAVAGLSLKVDRGEVHGLLGPNGAGKTTTVKCIIGLLKPDMGEILFERRSVADGPEYKASIGYLPEDPALPDYLRPREFLGYVGRLRGLGGDRLMRRVGELMELLGLGDVDDFIANLSRGMRQRLAVAAAFIHSPKLLLLDEPFIGIDPEGQKTVKEMILKVAEEGGAVLISTHMLELAERICTHATIIHRGRSLGSGSLEELKSMAGLDSGAHLDEVYRRLVEWARHGRSSPSS